MQLISLFSGIGGFDLALERAGMECVAQVEFDKAASAVLEHHYPDVLRLGDVRDAGYQNLPRCDVLVGGFPCQDLSVAGKRKGLAGGRSGLWFEFHRIIRELRPRYVIIENVPGLLSSNKGRDFATLLGGLTGWIPDVPDTQWRTAGAVRGYRGNYHVAWRVLDAQYFGVPQRRRRVFLVASLGDGSCAEILFEPESSLWNPSAVKRQRAELARDASASLRERSGKDFEAGLTVTGTLSASGAGSARPAGQANETDMLVYGMRRSDHYEPASVGSTLAARDYKSATDLVLAEAIDVRNLRSNGDVSGTLQSKDQGYSLNYINPVSITEHKPIIFMAGQGAKAGSIAASETLFPTLKGASSGTNQSPSIAIHQTGVRRLTPTECERLQGFPDGWTAVNNQADTARYKQLGNAVAVPVVEWIARRIAAAAGKG